MISGYTGEAFRTDVFIGPVYYQRLRHMVSDKFQVSSPHRSDMPHSMHAYILLDMWAILQSLRLVWSCCFGCKVQVILWGDGGEVKHVEYCLADWGGRRNGVTGCLTNFLPFTMAEDQMAVTLDKGMALRTEDAALL